MKNSKWQEVACAKKKSQRMEGTQESFWETSCLLAEKKDLSWKTEKPVLKQNSLLFI